MTTTIHLPPELLKRVERRARDLGISRNRYIRSALEKMVEHEASWSRPFLKMLEQAAADTEGQKTLDDMMRAIASRRTRKKPPVL